MAGSKMTSTTPNKMRTALKRGESKTDVAKVRAKEHRMSGMARTRTNGR
jgi:hypothetical protein